MKKTATAALVAVGIATPMWGQEVPCNSREKAIQTLYEGYGETIQSQSLNSVGNVVEIWANTKTGTWSLIITLPDGRACLAMSGQAYEGGIEMLLGDET